MDTLTDHLLEHFTCSILQGLTGMELVFTEMQNFVSLVDCLPARFRYILSLTGSFQLGCDWGLNERAICLEVQQKNWHAAFSLPAKKIEKEQVWARNASFSALFQLF